MAGPSGSEYREPIADQHREVAPGDNRLLVSLDRDEHGFPRPGSRRNRLAYDDRARAHLGFDQHPVRTSRTDLPHVAGQSYRYEPRMSLAERIPTSRSSATTGTQLR